LVLSFSFPGEAFFFSETVKTVNVPDIKFDSKYPMHVVFEPASNNYKNLLNGLIRKYYYLLLTLDVSVSLTSLLQEY